MSDWIVLREDGSSVETYDRYRPAVELARAEKARVVCLYACGCIYAPFSKNRKLVAKDPLWLPLERASANMRKRSTCPDHAPPGRMKSHPKYVPSVGAFVKLVNRGSAFENMPGRVVRVARSVVYIHFQGEKAGSVFGIFAHAWSRRDVRPYVEPVASIYDECTCVHLAEEHSTRRGCDVEGCTCTAFPRDAKARANLLEF